MNRTSLPNRRPCISTHVFHTTADGRLQKYHVTFGSDSAGRVREIFCDDSKSGSDMQAMLVGASIWASKLLQFGISPSELAEDAQGSVLGTLARAAAELERGNT